MGSKEDLLQVECQGILQSPKYSAETPFSNLVLLINIFGEHGLLLNRF